MRARCDAVESVEGAGSTAASAFADVDPPPFLAACSCPLRSSRSFRRCSMRSRDDWVDSVDSTERVVEEVDERKELSRSGRSLDASLAHADVPRVSGRSAGSAAPDLVLDAGCGFASEGLVAESDALYVFMLASLRLRSSRAARFEAIESDEPAAERPSADGPSTLASEESADVPRWRVPSRGTSAAFSVPSALASALAADLASALARSSARRFSTSAFLDAIDDEDDMDEVSSALPPSLTEATPPAPSRRTRPDGPSRVASERIADAPRSRAPLVTDRLCGSRSAELSSPRSELSASEIACSRAEVRAAVRASRDRLRASTRFICSWRRLSMRLACCSASFPMSSGDAARG